MSVVFHRPIYVEDQRSELTHFLDEKKQVVTVAEPGVIHRSNIIACFLRFVRGQPFNSLILSSNRALLTWVSYIAVDIDVT